jgi:hypothetical protein
MMQMECSEQLFLARVLGSHFDQFCQITCSSSTSIFQLKAKVEAEAGLPASSSSDPEHLPARSQPAAGAACHTQCGLPSKLYALILHKIVISEMLGVGC